MIEAIYTCASDNLYIYDMLPSTFTWLLYIRIIYASLGKEFVRSKYLNITLK